jgi:hypothetical protein
MREVSKKKKATTITSPRSTTPKRSSRRGPRGRTQKARVISVEEGSGKILFNSDVVGRSTEELAAGMADPLERAIEALKPDVGVDVIVLSDDGEVRGFVEGKYPAPEKEKGKHRKSMVYRYLTAGVTPQLVRPSTDELAERMLPEIPVPSPAQAALAQRESQARWGMLEEFGAFTSEELADQRSQAKNRHALANRWRSEGKVFAVELRGRRLFPGFQFNPETFAPEPVIAEALAALPREQMSEWEVALWWVAADPWLEGRRPVDVMQGDPGAVVAAAAGLSEPSPL